mmetsp:Transcript_55770/g.118635  ORF Transcript_55770/g.118635 Transcript_55770/m.118635 type:complete len:309 (+) Transcript_55770:1054-1980(+)
MGVLIRRKPLSRRAETTLREVAGVGLRSPSASRFTSGKFLEPVAVDAASPSPLTDIPSASEYSGRNTLTPSLSRRSFNASISPALGSNSFSRPRSFSHCSRAGFCTRPSCICLLRSSVMSTSILTRHALSFVKPGLKYDAGNMSTALPMYPVSSANSLSAAAPGSSPASIRPAGSSIECPSTGGRNCFTHTTSSFVGSFASCLSTASMITASTESSDCLVVRTTRSHLRTPLSPSFSGCTRYVWVSRRTQLVDPTVSVLSKSTRGRPSESPSLDDGDDMAENEDEATLDLNAVGVGAGMNDESGVGGE